MQSTITDISRSVSLIRAALCSPGGASKTCPRTLLSAIETELSRLIAQAEGADEMLSGSGMAIRAEVARLHATAGSACEVAGHFISRHTAVGKSSRSDDAKKKKVLHARMAQVLHDQEAEA